MINTTVKANGLEEFNKTIAEYAKWSKRQPAEIANAKLYFIALQAMRATKKADKTAIVNELNAPSEKNPEISLGSILTSIELSNKGRKKGSATQFASKVQKFIRRRASHVGFLMSGWLPAIKKLDFYNRSGDISFSKRYAPKRPVGIKQFGKDKGDVTPAKQNETNARGTIFNFIGQGKQKTPTVTGILQDGLDEGIRKEIASMREYIEKKYNEYHQKLENKYRYKGN